LSDFYEDIIEFPYYINKRQQQKNYFYDDARKIPYQADNQLKYENAVLITPIKDAESNPNNLKYRHRTNKKSIVAGLDNMRPIDERSCLNNILRANISLSSPVQCARTCIKDDHKICYYNFVVENYQVNGL
jgi:hypothetical protein